MIRGYLVFELAMQTVHNLKTIKHRIMNAVQKQTAKLFEKKHIHTLSTHYKDYL